MTDPPIVYVADVHTEKHLRAGRPIFGDDAFALKQAVDLAVDRRAAAFIGAGDLVNRQQTLAYPLKVWEAAIRRLRQAGIPFFFIEGQHDLDDPPKLAYAGARTAAGYHLHRKIVRVGGLRVAGLNFQPPAGLRRALAAIAKAKPDVLVCHQVWAEWMGTVASPQGSFADVAGVRLMVTGDLHETRVERHRGADGRPYTVVSPGSLTQRSIDEPAQKHAVVVGADLAVELVPIRTRGVLDCRPVADEDELDALVVSLPGAVEALRRADLPDEIRAPLVRVTYAHGLPDVRRRVERAVGKACHLVWNALPAPEEAEAAEAVAGGRGALTTLAALDEEINRDREPDAYDLVHRFLTAGDAAADVLPAWEAAFLARSEK